MAGDGSSAGPGRDMTTASPASPGSPGHGGSAAGARSGHRPEAWGWSVVGVKAARVVFPAQDRAEIAAAIAGLLASGMLTLGPYTRQFEAAFAAAHAADPESADEI